MLAAVVFAALCVHALLDVWRAPADPARVPKVTATAVAPQRAALRANVAAISGRHLFGTALPAREEAPPPTRAALVLGGIWYSPAGEVYAVIGEPGAAQKAYRTGDRLPGGLELAGIELDHVLLRRDGKTETLALPRSSLPSRPAGAAQARR